MEESRLKVKNETDPHEKSQAYAARMRTLNKGKFRRSRQKKKPDMSKMRCFECNELDHSKRDCLKISNQKKGTNRKDGAHAVEEIKEPENKRPKEEDPRDLFF